MWPIVFIGLLIASLAGWVFTWWSQRVRIRALERSKEEIQIEETLVFDFLHGLGEAFTETIRAADLHRLIVEGAARILDAHQALCDAVPQNFSRFKDVLDYLHQDLHKESPSN